MREPIPVTDEMIKELIKLRKNGMGLRPLAQQFGVSHQTIKNWLDSRPVKSRFSESIGLACGDRAALKRDVTSGPYKLQAGEDVRIDELNPAANVAWVSCFRTLHRSVDVPQDALEPKKKRNLRT